MTLVERYHGQPRTAQRSSARRLVEATFGPLGTVADAMRSRSERAVNVVRAVACGVAVGLAALGSSTAHAQMCPPLHAADYAPVVDKGCGNWVLQRMDRANPRFGPSGWQLDDHGKHFILVANYNKSSDRPNFEYFHTIDRALLVDDADLRVGKARPLVEDRIDAALEEAAIGLYLEEGYAASLGFVR